MRAVKRVLAWVMAIGLAAGAAAETFDLRDYGKLEVFVAEGFKIAAEDLGDRHEIIIAPKREGGPQAAARLVVNLTPADEFNSKAKLRERVIELCAPAAEQNNTRRYTAQEFYSRQGFGFYCTFTDPKLVGKAPVKDDFKHVTLGAVRLGPRVYVSVTLLADDLEGAEYQALLGTVEGMELRP
jgi:hypothetical protein